MSQRITGFVKNSFTYVWMVALAAYVTVLAGQAMFRNYESQKDTKTLQAQLDAATTERDRLNALVAYYQTDAYREKELRRSFLLQLPGEQVYALPESAIGRKVEEEQAVRKIQEDPHKKLPNWQQWGEFLLGK